MNLEGSSYCDSSKSVIVKSQTAVSPKKYRINIWENLLKIAGDAV